MFVFSPVKFLMDVFSVRCFSMSGSVWAESLKYEREKSKRGRELGCEAWGKRKYGKKSHPGEILLSWDGAQKNWQLIL